MLVIWSNPTRFVNHNLPSLIDHIWYSNTDMHNCGIISIDFTDLSPCFVTLKYSVNIDERELTKIPFRLINETKTNIFLSVVRVFDWNEKFSEEINVTSEIFTFVLDNLSCKIFPMKATSATNKQLSKP